MKRLSLFGLSLLVASALFASPFARYRIRLRDGSRVLAADRPYVAGTVLMFHRYPDGVLTGLPEEDVVEFGATAGGDTVAIVVPRTTDAPRMLQPGDAIDVGETGGGAAPAASQPAAASYAAPANAPAYGTGAYGGGVYAPRAPNGTPLTAAAVTAMNAAVASGSPGIASNGFPTTAGSVATVGATTIGPDGTPILTPAGQPGSVLPAIGSDGMPIIAPGIGTATTLAIGSNGTAVLGSSSFSGSAAATIGANGTPILAPSGSPGSAALTIGANGTPILAPAGTPGAAQPVIAPNGTPAAPAPHR